MITNLTEKGIQKAQDFQNLVNLKENLVVQALASINDAGYEKKITISDGFAECDAYVESSQYDKIKDLLEDEEVKYFPVIQISKFEMYTDPDSGEEYFKILNLNVIYDKVKEKIGLPIQYELYQLQENTNERGNNQIPQEFYKKEGQNANKQGEVKQKQEVDSANKSSKLNKNDLQYNPISMLYPGQYGWILKARVASKSNLRDFVPLNNKRQSQGPNSNNKVFSIDIIDWNQEEIQCSFFNEAADKFYNLIQEGNVYQFSNGIVKMSNLTYSKNEYQITFDVNASIKQLENDETIQNQAFNFTKISAIRDLPKDSLIDVVGIISECHDVNEIQRKNGEKITQRRLYIFDDSLVKIEVTLWGHMAENQNLSNNNILVIKQARIQEFQEVKNLSVSFNGKMFINDSTIPESKKLGIWKQNPDNMLKEVESMGEYKASNVIFELSSFAQIEEQAETMKNQIGEEQKPVYHNVLAYLTYVNPDSSMFYPACPMKDCQKKVNINDDNTIDCSKCGTLQKLPVYRYIAQIRLTDSSGSLYVSVYDKAGLQIFNASADTVKEMKDSLEPAQFGAKISENYFKEQVYKIQTRVETYQGVQRAKHQVQAVYEPNSTKICMSLANQIEKYLNI